MEGNYKGERDRGNAKDQMVNVERMLKWENHHFAVTVLKTRSGMSK